MAIAFAAATASSPHHLLAAAQTSGQTPSVYHDFEVESSSVDRHVTRYNERAGDQDAAPAGKDWGFERRRGREGAGKGEHQAADQALGGGQRGRQGEMAAEADPGGQRGGTGETAAEADQGRQRGGQRVAPAEADQGGRASATNQLPREEEERGQGGGAAGDFGGGSSNEGIPGGGVHPGAADWPRDWEVVNGVPRPQLSHLHAPPQALLTAITPSSLSPDDVQDVTVPFDAEAGDLVEVRGARGGGGGSRPPGCPQPLLAIPPPPPPPPPPPTSSSPPAFPTSTHLHHQVFTEDGSRYFAPVPSNVEPGATYEVFTHAMVTEER